MYRALVWGVGLFLLVGGCGAGDEAAEDRNAAVEPMDQAFELADAPDPAAASPDDVEVPVVTEAAEEAPGGYEGALGGGVGAGSGGPPPRRARRARPAQGRMEVHPSSTAVARHAARPSGALRSPTAAPAALPQNAVLSSTFVGGSGAQARLEDLLDRGVMVDGENVRLAAFEELGRLPYPVPAR